MALTVPNGGKLAFLDLILANVPLYCHLYKTDTTIDRTVTGASFTEANYTGYAAQLTASWAASTIDGSNRATSSAAQLTFTLTGGSAQDIYGYVLINSASLVGGSVIYAAERFSMAPIHLAVAGDSILLTPNLTAKSEF